MKRFTKTLFIVLVAVAFVATGCKKESEYKTVTLGAKIAANNSKVYIDTYTPKWQTGDQVRVNGTDESHTITVDGINGNTAMLPNVPVSNDGYYAIYPAEYATAFANGQFTVTLPAIQEYTEVDGNQVVKAPMGAKTTDGSSLTFHNLCSLLKVTVTAGETLKISGIKVTAGTTNLSGSTSITLSGNATDALPAPGTGSKSVTLSFGNTGKELTNGESYDFYIYLPAFPTTPQNVSVEVYNIDANNILGVKKKTFDGISVSANTINTVGTGSLTAASFTTTGAINGLFSVSDDSGVTTRQIRFSKGNLQATYTDGDWTWAFATNQWDYIGGRTDGGSELQTGNNYINGTGTMSANGTVDLFGWSTNVNQYGIDNSNNSVNYSGDFKDWGANAISNGGNTANQWRTLTKDEWDYLLKTRTASTVNGTENARYAKAYLFGTTHGLIIFPDSYNHPEGVTQPTGINADGSTSWNANQFTPADWAKMEAAGCVFLPAAGYRNGTDVDDVGYNGNYWSYTSNLDYNAYSVYFIEDNLITGYDDGRAIGMSVRPVQDAN